jgi:hypothetical protein
MEEEILDIAKMIYHNHLTAKYGTKLIIEKQRNLLIAYENFRLMSPDKFSCAEQAIDKFLEYENRIRQSLD